MRTTITVSDQDIHELLHYTHAKKATQAINIALQEWIRLKKITQIKKLRGTLSITDNLRALRSREIKKLEKWHDQAK